MNETAEAPVEEYTPEPVSIKSLMKAGAHFGHQTQRWNPRMAKYIFTERNGIHIINLDITLDAWEKARKFISDIASRGGEILFVGTKQQAQGPIRAAAERSASYYVTSRWLGGTLSNFKTIKNSIRRMNKLEELLVESQKEDSKVRLAKKERMQISKNLTKLEANIGGIRTMKKLPSLLFVVDVNKEAIAVHEARKLRIPVVALVDTNTDPGTVAFPIPSNDDSSRTISLFAQGVADAILEGKEAYKERVGKDEDKKKKGASSEPEANGSSAGDATSAPQETASAG